MKKIFVIAALAAVSACSKPAPAPDAEASATQTADASTAGPVAADGKPSAGKFKITTADGKTLIEEDKADGTYSTTQDGKVVETGKWDQKAGGLFCFTKDGKDAKQQCNEEKVENGVWTTKSPDGKVSIVERVTG